MAEQFELDIEVMEEAGYRSAMLGISFNKDQPVENMPAVAQKLAPLDLGHNKYLEQIMVWMVVRAPRYWWQEADTFRLSSKSSQSTMHTILKNELHPLNFECVDMQGIDLEYLNHLLSLKMLVELKRKLPEGFMQKRMWMMSYKTLRNIILQRRNHRLPHWKWFILRILSQVQHPELLPSASGIEDADSSKLPSCTVCNSGHGINLVINNVICKFCPECGRKIRPGA